MSKSIGLQAVLAGAVLFSAQVAALEFTPKVDAQGRAILIVHDRSPCADGDHTCGFTPGDSGRLDQYLASRSFYEVWFASGGGALVEGVQVGEVLRQRRIKVRVPDGAICASSCTVAFMGGLIRSIDPNGSFLVHSASSVMGGVQSAAESTMLRDPQLALAARADEEYTDGKAWAAVLVAYFQTMLNGRPDKSAIERAVEAGPARLPYVTNGDLDRDARKIRADGAMVTQEIVMSLERRGIAQAIENLKPSIAALGPRAAPAIQMLQTMYTSSILGVAELSPQTLYELGYVNVRAR